MSLVSPESEKSEKQIQQKLSQSRKSLNAHPVEVTLVIT